MSLFGEWINTDKRFIESQERDSIAVPSVKNKQEFDC